MKPGDYRHVTNPTAALDDVRAASDANYIQHVFCDIDNPHRTRLDKEGVPRCTSHDCILNKGRVWRAKKK